MFEKFNQFTNTVKEGIDLQSMEFTPLKSFIGQTVVVDGFFFTNGRYGKQLVVVGNGYKINMPAREVKTFEAFMEDASLMNAIFNGGLALVDIREKSTKNGTTVVFKYADARTVR